MLTRIKENKNDNRVVHVKKQKFEKNIFFILVVSPSFFLKKKCNLFFFSPVDLKPKNTNPNLKGKKQVKKLNFFKFGFFM